MYGVPLRVCIIACLTRHVYHVVMSEGDPSYAAPAAITRHRGIVRDYCTLQLCEGSSGAAESEGRRHVVDDGYHLYLSMYSCVYYAPLTITLVTLCHYVDVGKKIMSRRNCTFCTTAAHMICSPADGCNVTRPSHRWHQLACRS